MTPYALNGPSCVFQEQMETLCPQNHKQKKENQPLSDIQMKDKYGLDIKRITQHAMYTTHFLHGKTSYSVGTILECWYLSSDGHVHEGLAEDVSLYSTTFVYTSIKPACAALTVFAAQLSRRN